MRSVLLLLAVLSGSVASAEPSATVPLDELLRLYRADDAAKEPAETPPPVRASVSSVVLEGRLLDGAIELTAQFTVTVLTDDEWVAVRLFEKDQHTTISRLPEVPDATFSVIGGSLVLVTQKAATSHFEIVLRKSAIAGARQRVDLNFAEAAQATLKLHCDDNLFRLLSSGSVDEGDGVTLYPEGGRFVVEWERIAAKQQTKRQRPPVESVITAAHASVVSTLAGSMVTRLAYNLRLEGVRPIELTLPEGEVLDRVYINGASTPAEAHDGVLRLDVSPARAGDETARVEVVLKHEHGGYALSGKLDFQFPAVSWSCNELFVTLHLPQAFNYWWDDGSLAAAESVPEQACSYEIPTPGKMVFLHQQLVQRAPTARVNYSVDLAESYFK